MTNVFEWHFLDSPPPHGCNSKEKQNEEEGISDQKDLGTLFVLLKDKMKWNMKLFFWLTQFKEVSVSRIQLGYHQYKPDEVFAWDASWRRMLVWMIYYFFYICDGLVLTHSSHHTLS